jgi:hypothetical protein
MFQMKVVKKQKQKKLNTTFMVNTFSLNLRDKKNSVALVRERTIPTERPPLVDEVSANFCG